MRLATTPLKMMPLKIVWMALVVPVLLQPAVAGAQSTPGAARSALLAPDSPEAKAVLAPVNGLFAALDVGDAAATLRQVFPAGLVTASGRNADGTSNIRQQTWSQFGERIAPERAFQERITRPVISIDDDVAVVWAPFVVRRGGKVANCGIDHFDLVRENGTWKILNLTYSTRTTGCPAQ